MPDTYISQFSGEEIDSALRAAQIISGADTPAELREKLEIRGDTIPVSATDPTPVSEALTASGGGVNPNLLDNWYFANPVNQRGKTSYGQTPQYSIDRWMITNDYAYVDVADGYITLRGNDVNGFGGIIEKLESSVKNALLDKTITLSFFAKLYTTCSIGGTQIAPTDNFELYSATFHSTSADYVLLNAVTAVTQGAKIADILAAKLELGDTQTLAHKENGVWVLNEIPDFGEQLRRCTYYAEKVESKDTPAITNSTFVPSGATSAVFILPYARKRTVPAINFNDVSNYRIIARSISGGTTAFSVTAISLLDIGRTKAAILVSFNTTDQGYYCFLQRSDNAPAGYAFISADL